MIHSFIHLIDSFDFATKIEDTRRMANRVGYNPDDKVSGYLKFNDAVVAGVLVGGSTR
jgi:hypothetical protein